MAVVIFMLKHSVQLRRYLLCGCVAAHNKHAILGHAATPPRNKLRRNITECFNINITLARLDCKLPEDCRGSKNVGAI